MTFVKTHSIYISWSSLRLADSRKLCSVRKRSDSTKPPIRMEINHMLW